MHHARSMLHNATGRVKPRRLTTEDRERTAAAWSIVQADLRTIRGKFGARADDVESAVAWRLTRSIHTYDADRGSLAHWSRLVVRSAIRDYMRRRRSDRCVRLPDEPIASPRDEGRERIARDGLGRRARLIAFARADGCSYAETARIVGLRSKSTAYVVMRETAAIARRRLAEL